MTQALNESLAVFLINDDARGIRCSYVVALKHSTGEDMPQSEDNAKTYFFKSFDKSLKVGDLVVVPSRGERNAVPFTVVRVVEVDCKAPHKEVSIDFKWIVCRAQVEQYDETIAQEKQLFDMMEEKREIAATNELRRLMHTEDDASDYEGLAIAGTSNALPAPKGDSPIPDSGSEDEYRDAAQPVAGTTIASR